MKHLDIHDSAYTTGSRKIPMLSRVAPTLSFYSSFAGVLLRASHQAKRGRYGDAEWLRSSHTVLKLLERSGVQFSISGLDYLQNPDEPGVLVGNHMSMMETLILPIIVNPLKKITFVVKENLLTYPLFQHVMRSRNPIAVTRTNPRQDLKTVMTEGVERLSKGISVIVFPQTTRTHDFDPAEFGSIGIKLAKKAEVPVIPFALKTDTWQNGALLKDFGRINPEIPVHIAFDKPLRIEGKGTDTHKHVVDFIAAKLADWQQENEKGQRLVQ